MFQRANKFVDPTTRQTYDFASEIPCLGDNTAVFQLDLENGNSWYQLLPDPMPFNKSLLFKPTELGHITQFTTFDTRRAGTTITFKSVISFTIEFNTTQVSNPIALYRTN